MPNLQIGDLVKFNKDGWYELIVGRIEKLDSHRNVEHISYGRYKYVKPFRTIKKMTKEEILLYKLEK